MLTFRPPTLLSLALAACVATLASAHMQMMSPPPLRSTYNKNTVEADKDYSMTAPLSATAYTDGQFPCKGYHKSAKNQQAVATYSAGQSVTVQLAGVNKSLPTFFTEEVSCRSSS
jgi:hypothetical protein